MATSRIRVLVVDDYEPWRRFVTSTIEKQLGFLIVGEASDGLTAAEKAQELQPDLIVLDIGLPSLNGVEAAGRIRNVSPASKILFASENRSSDILEEALNRGMGYLVKSDAGRELLPAVKAVLEGTRFVSASLAGHQVSTANDPVARDDRRTTVASISSRKVRHHEVVFYLDDRQLLNHVTKLIGDPLKSGHSAIVMATESHRNSLVRRLQAYGLDCDTAIAQGRYIVLDAADVLSTFMLNGMPDSIRFMEAFRNLVQRASKAKGEEHSRIPIFGECVRILVEQGNAEAAIQMEELGNQLAALYNVEILCGYCLASKAGAMDSQIFHRICEQHSAVHSC